MRGIILDTNFLMIPFTLKVDIFSELKRVCNFPFRLYVVDKTLDELRKIQEQGRMKDRKAAKMASEMAEDIEKIETGEGHVDDLILETARKNGYYVATQDWEFKKKLKNKGVPLIYLRQKKYVVVENVL